VKQQPEPVPLSTSSSRLRRARSRDSDVAERKLSTTGVGKLNLIRTPDIQLHCTNESCNGPRFFRYLGGEPERLTEKWQSLPEVPMLELPTDDKTFSLAAKLDAIEAVRARL